MSETVISEDQVVQALSRVDDPELGRPITELGMVKSITITGSDVAVVVNLTIAGCPLKNTIVANCRAVLEEIPGIGDIDVTTDVMSDEQRRELKGKLSSSHATQGVNPFTQPGNTTQVFAIASGKGGVGKSSMTVNLAVALAQQGLNVGVLDADIYGHSIPALLGSQQAVTQVDDMIMPPQAHGVKHISIGHFVEGNSPIVWRGPMLHRAINQFLTDVFWGDLDVLLLDLPPGTGDVAITVAQLLPMAELVIVTTPQMAAAEVAERAGALALQTHQTVRGVIENMAGVVLPDGQVLNVFGEGGGQVVAQRLADLTGTDVPVLGQVPLEQNVSAGGDAGVPIVVSEPESAAAKAITSIAQQLVKRTSSLKGQPLGVQPTRH